MGETWRASTAFGLVWKVGYCKCICFNVYLQSGTTIVVMCFLISTVHDTYKMEWKKKTSIYYLPVLDERTCSSLWSSKVYWQQVRDSQESHVRPMFGAHRVIRILLFLLRGLVSLAEVLVDALVSVTFSDKEVACSSHLLLYMPVTFFLDCSCSFFWMKLLLSCKLSKLL